ncbi:MAG: Asparagine synthase, glutamine-hydrolyzing, partial [Deltaproteobacteria bacterium]|nr:Asparagine synthase, glutamine-hydrolyzing [Deltaproteobacteria bacterium]
MCGIVGFSAADPRGAAPCDLDSALGTLGRRGPDGKGRYADAGTLLGHTRLSIIDLSTGDQPMTNEDGSLWIVFNGEIYNYRELQGDLRARGHVLRTTSDT